MLGAALCKLLSPSQQPCEMGTNISSIQDKKKVSDLPKDMQ